MNRVIVALWLLIAVAVTANILQMSGAFRRLEARVAELEACR